MLDSVFCEKLLQYDSFCQQFRTYKASGRIREWWLSNRGPVKERQRPLLFPKGLLKALRYLKPEH
jgi:hypothetical protein